MLAKPSTELTMHTHPSAGVFSLLKFALSREEEEEEVKGVVTVSKLIRFRRLAFVECDVLHSRCVNIVVSYTLHPKRVC